VKVAFVDEGDAEAFHVGQLASDVQATKASADNDDVVGFL
jgi:hypothetical protein